MEDLSILNDMFNLYYKKANQAKNAGNVTVAKRNYLLAAETMMKMAKVNKNKLQQAQFNRAKRIIEFAENLNEENIGKSKSSRSTQSLQDDDENDEDSKSWKGAKIPDIHFSDIAGLDNVKKTIMVRMINPIKYPEKYELYGKKSGGGVLLYGPPGTGKTMIAKAIACEVGATFFAIKGSDILSKWVGESEKNIGSLFETAKEEKMAIIFVDEMDSLFGSRGKDIHNDKRVNEFLQQIDGFAGRCPNLLLLGATNRPWDVDSAAVRSGRFSEKIYVSLPDLEARKFLVSKFLGSTPVEEDFNIEKLAQRMDGFSGADIEEICDRAKIEPLEQYIKTDVVVKVTMEDFEKAISNFSPSVTTKDLQVFEDYKSHS